MPLLCGISFYYFDHPEGIPQYAPLGAYITLRKQYITFPQEIYHFPLRENITAVAEILFRNRHSSEPFLFQVSAIRYRIEANIFCLDINKTSFKILQNRQRTSLCRNRITNIRYSYRRDRKLRKLCSPDLPCPYRMRSKPHGGRYRLRERYAYKREYGAWSTS